MRKLVCSAVAAAIALVALPGSATDYHVDATTGDDGFDGASPTTAWRSLDRVNAGGLQPGDRVLFKRGETFRGQLQPTSGTEGDAIVYGAYGTGEMPKLMGSVERNGSASWSSLDGNVWTTTGPFAASIGNIIFDGETCGWLKLDSADVLAPGDFWFNTANQTLELYATSNPADAWTDIELAVNRHIINNSGVSHVVYEGLHLLYGAAHGIGGSNSHHVTVRGCEISYIGGGLLTPTVRFGNGIEFWEETHDNLVEGNRIWQIYDAALTNQGAGQSTQANIVYRNNVVWDAEYCFECWQRPASSEIHDIYFENNTCAYSGHGWGHEQRPDPNGWHLIFWGMEAPPTNFFVRNNVFYEALLCAFESWDGDGSWLAGAEVDYNLYLQSTGAVACTHQGDYTQAEFAAYQSDTGRDVHSVAADPLFVSAEQADFHLLAGSPAIDRGVDNGLSFDLDGAPRPQGAAIDLGAYEHSPSVPPDAGAPDAGHPPDAAVPDAATELDGGQAATSERDTGCGCIASGRGTDAGTPGWILILLAATGLWRRQPRCPFDCAT
jgi:hypothetical protein